MKVMFYGTRGSVPISNPSSVEYGGNTTSVRIISECLPEKMALVVDAGSGFVPLSFQLLQENIEDIALLFSHYHHDHTQGLFLSPTIFIKGIRMRLFGPIESQVDPDQMMKDMMRSPYFPVDYKEVASHITCKGFDYPRTWVCLFHPIGGMKTMRVDEYERLVQAGKTIPIGSGKYAAEECLVVTMYKSRHPESTISYRFEEKPTGKVFVFLTDHENEDGIPMALRAHLQNADLLVMDAQYTRDKYQTKTAGYGHGTADYCVRVAENVDAKVLGLTHHDLTATDADVEAVLAEGRSALNGSSLQLFACRDYQTVEI
jgi:phosphoribosyl 1,2-cyclic phosphodiesterase